MRVKGGKLNPANVKKLSDKARGDRELKREAIDEIRGRGFRAFVQENFELTDRQRRELERVPKQFHDVAGNACITALELGGEVELIPHERSPNLAVELYCKVEGECGVRISGEC